MDKPKPTIREALIAAGEIVLVLRCVHADMTSRNGFRWPELGEVSAPDWAPTKECGQGLHGWLWGAGNLAGTCDYWSGETTRWLVVEVPRADLVDLDGKVKYPRGVVVFCGPRDEAVSLIVQHAPAGTPIMFGTATAGDRGTATAGDGGTATAGDRGTVSILYYDAKRDRYRKAIAEIDAEGDYKPGVTYHVVDGRIAAKDVAK